MSHSRSEQLAEVRDDLARDKRAGETAETCERLHRWCIQWLADNPSIKELTARMLAETDVGGLTNDELEAVAEKAATQVSQMAMHLLVGNHKSNGCPMCTIKCQLDAVARLTRNP